MPQPCATRLLQHQREAGTSGKLQPASAEMTYRMPYYSGFRTRTLQLCCSLSGSLCDGQGSATAPPTLYAEGPPARGPVLDQRGFLISPHWRLHGLGGVACEANLLGPRRVDEGRNLLPCSLVLLCRPLAAQASWQGREWYGCGWARIAGRASKKSTLGTLTVSYWTDGSVHPGAKEAG